VDDLLHHAANVAIALSVVESAELGGGLVQAGVGREDGTATFTLVANDTTHFGDGVGGWAGRVVSCQSKSVEMRASWFQYY
jgi:hypothetical protein